MDLLDLNIPQHDDVACQALAAYENAAEEYDQLHFVQIHTKYGPMNGQRIRTPITPRPSMSDYANKYGTTIEAMKRHWKCVEVKIIEK